MTKVNFYINAEKELNYLKVYVKMCGKNKLTNSALQLLELDDSSAKKEILNEYEKDEFKAFIDNIQINWKNIESKYFDRIVKITGYDWNLEEYECLLTNNVPGFAVIPEKKIVVIGKEFRKGDTTLSLPLESQLYVLAHELFHLHYFEVARKQGLPIEAIKIEMTETVPVIVFFYDSELPKYWPSISLEKAKGSYKEVLNTFDWALELWNNKKDYISFLRNFADKLKSTNNAVLIKDK